MRRLIALLLFSASPALAQAPESFTFESWYAACDNLRRCAVLSPQAAGDDAPVMFFRLARGGAAGDRPAIRLVRENRDIPPGPWTVLVDGKVIAQAGAPAAAADGFQRAELPPEAVDALRDGGRAVVQAGQQVLGAIALRGSAAVLRWVDDRQGRTGTTTALAARGPAAPAGGPAAMPTLRAATLPPQGNLPRRPGQALLGAAGLRDCDDDARRAAPEVFRLAADTLLWALPCFRGAYNTQHRLMLTDAAGGAPRPAELPRPGRSQDANGVVNFRFDRATATLSSLALGRGIGDCGEAGRWVWDGTAFRLLHLAAIEDCRGVPLEDWPVLYEARRG